ncbi:MAG: tetratricopeptide repeat protein, partial [Pseudomonadota bacterium]|nr:tetratricopeptide repeat protein [Pseudomonadota bacterium]
GEYNTGANLYFRAMQNASARSAQRDYFLSGLRTLQAGGLYDELINAADAHLGKLSDDSATLLALARMAQAANRLDAAERYARLLLRLTQRNGNFPSIAAASRWQTPAQFYAALRAAPRRAVRLQTVGTGVASIDRPDWLPFNEEAYSLSFTIFLANGNLHDARRVAEHAVQERPDDPVWRKRLAQVNDWSSAPAQALPQWLAVARLTGDEAAWDTVMRLAIGLNDSATQLIVIEHKIGAEPDNPLWLAQLIQIRENAGQPELALNLLRERLARGASHGPARQRELELFAALAERSGHDDDAFQALQSLQDQFGANSAVALRIAGQWYRRGQPGKAFAAMERAAAGALPSDTEFWRTYAELARLLQDDRAAKQGYRQLLAGDAQNDSDLFNLIALLDAREPLAAARLAEYGFARSGNTRFALQALSLRARLMDWSSARAVLTRLSPPQRAALEADPQFLALRAAVEQSTNQLAAAVRDLRAALLLRPADMELRAGMLWALIAARDAPALQAALHQWAGDAEHARILWDPYAAANMSLNRQDQAVHWFRKAGWQQQDPLWLMSYAEALEATAQRDAAWQIRRHVWQQLRKPAVLQAASVEQIGALRDRLVALSPLFLNGDGAQRVIAALLRADVTSLRNLPAPAQLPRNGREMLAQLDRVESVVLPEVERVQRLRQAQQATDPLTALLSPGTGVRPADDARLTAAARELALAYALNRNANELASAWFATRFAGQLARPLWGELSLLLLADDRAQLDRLLDDLPDWLPMYDRIEAAQRAGRPALAESFAFDQLARLPFDEDLHERLTNLSTDQPANLSSAVTQQRQSPLDTRTKQVHLALDLSTRLKLALTLADSAYRSSDPSQLTNLPARDRQIDLTLRERTESGFMAATLTRRQGLAERSGLRFETSLAPTGALGIVANVGIRQAASESALLRVAALRDGGEVGMTYQISRNEYARGGLGWRRYLAQGGLGFGSGSNWNLEVGSHLRIDYPNLTLRAYAAGSRYHDLGRIDGATAALLPPELLASGARVLPQNDRLLGLAVGVGTVTENRYSRAWRPFAELGLTRSQVAGNGYNLRAGIAGSVFGQDLMTLRGLHVSGTAAAPQGSQEIGLDYQWFF